MSTAVPSSITREHRHLRSNLAKAALQPGLVGVRARELAQLMDAHFAKEERCALPALGLLAKLAWGGATREMSSMIPVTRRLAAELPVMMVEHKEIVRAAERLKNAAAEAAAHDYVQLADALIVHAQYEEEVLYPAAVLVGAYLETKLAVDVAQTEAV